MIASWRRLLIAAMLCIAVPVCAVAQSDAPPAADAEQAPATRELSQQQQRLQSAYAAFEEELFRLAEGLRGSDPDRAQLLSRVRGESQTARVLQQMRVIAELLSEGNELGDAVSRQNEIIAQLEELLKILQSEDERDRLASDIERYEQWLAETNRIIGAQKDVRADTERRGDPQRLTDDQDEVAEDAEQLATQIEQHDGERSAGADGAPSESQPGGSESEPGEPSEDGMPSDEPRDDERAGDDEPPESEPGDSAESESSDPSSPSESQPGSPMESDSQSQSESQSPSDSQSQPREGSPSQPQPGSPSQPQSQSPGGRPQDAPPPEEQPSAQPSQGGPQDQQAAGEQTPGREELQRAIEEMEQAIEELRRQDHDGASDEQDQALAQLEALKAELEEILRQLREEERELFLTMLEARFQNMLRLQLQINGETARLDAVPAEQRGSGHLSKATDLSRNQRDNVMDAERALMFLKEEGSSVAFPEAVEQMRDNMIRVAGLLEEADTGGTTQLIEQIIVETLEEMILSLQKELEKMQDEEQQQQQQQQQEEQDPALVDVLAELKMIRSLQNQINRLTRQISLEIDPEQPIDPDTASFLDDLAARQERIQEATYDLSSGRTSLGRQLRDAGR